jgi:hypothetical protein
MADFYPVLARAVSCLPQNDAQARREVYARARKIVAEQLRGRSRQGVAIEAVREQAALENAIRKVESESQPIRAPMNGKPAVPRPPANGTAIGDAPGPSKTAAQSLAKILQAVQSDENHDNAPNLPGRKTTNGTKAPVASAPRPIAVIDNRNTIRSEELDSVPHLLGTMLFGITYIIAAVAFGGVTYIRCIVWVAQGVIGYPTLLVVMAITLALFIVPPLVIFRKASATPSFGNLLRFIYSASRRVF